MGRLEKRKLQNFSVHFSIRATPGFEALRMGQDLPVTDEIGMLDFVLKFCIGP